MKYNLGALVSLLLVFTGLYLLWKLDLAGNDLSMCILALVTGPSLCLTLLYFQLRGRIAALEKRAGNQQ